MYGIEVLKNVKYQNRETETKGLIQNFTTLDNEIYK
jgi:hypothetical protein